MKLFIIFSLGTLLALNVVASEDTKVESVTTKTFSPPKLGGMYVDHCRLWARECGKPAADAFCEEKGFDKSVEFDVKNVGGDGIPTFVIGQRVTCNEGICDALVRVVCEKRKNIQP